MANAAYWSSPAITSKTVEVLKLLNYCSLGAFLFDLIFTARFDWSIIAGKRQRKWPQLLYFATKIAYLTFLSLTTTFLWLENEVDCQALIIAIEWAMGATIITSSALLACRTVCVFSSTCRVVVTAALLVFGSGLIAAWMYGVQDATSAWTPAAASPWNTGACAFVSIKSTYYVKYIITIVFDLLVLCLTTIGIVRMNSSSRIGDVLIKHGLIYFILTLLANLVIAVLTTLKLSPIMSLMAATTQSLICVVASTRLYRDLVEEASTSHLASNHSSGSSSLYKKGTSSQNSVPTSTTSGRFDSFDMINGMEKGHPSQGYSNRVHIHQERTVETTPSVQGHPFSNTVALPDSDSYCPRTRG